MAETFDFITVTTPNGSVQYKAPPMAAEFSASTSYAAGDYCTYQGALYRFSAAHAAGAWTGTDAAVVSLAGDVSDLRSNIDDAGLTDEAKEALLDCFAHVAWIDEHGQDYYDALEEALYNTTWAITNNLTNCTTSNAATSVQKGGSYSATITASAGYVMTGATVSITMGGTDITATAYSNGVISIPAVTGALVISISAAAKTVSSISAVFSQGANVVYTNDTLDSLKQYLVVTATYTDSSTETVPSADYTLSGTLAEGTQTITVAFGGKTDTFTVDCTVNGYLYHFEQSLASSGSKDFGFSGSVTYDTGHDGSGYSFKNDPGCITASGYTPPTLDGDFTIAYWAKTLVAKNGQGFSPYKHLNTSDTLTAFASSENVKTGWTVNANAATNAYSAMRLGSWGGSTRIDNRIYNTDLTKGSVYATIPPTGFDSTAWHHYAWTRKNGIFMFFVDGSRIFTASISDTLAFANQCALGGWYDSDTVSVPSANKSWYDDLFVAEYCKWDSDFDPATIVY